MCVLFGQVKFAGAVKTCRLHLQEAVFIAWACLSLRRSCIILEIYFYRHIAVYIGYLYQPQITYQWMPNYKPSNWFPCTSCNSFSLFHVPSATMEGEGGVYELKCTEPPGVDRDVLYRALVSFFFYHVI